MFYLLDNIFGSAFNVKHFFLKFVCSLFVYEQTVLENMQLCFVKSLGKIIAWVEYFVQIINVPSSPKIWNKAEVFTLVTSIQNCTAG